MRMSNPLFLPVLLFFCAFCHNSKIPVSLLTRFGMEDIIRIEIKAWNIKRKERERTLHSLERLRRKMLEIDYDRELSR